MKAKDIKQVNITVIFSESLNHLLIPNMDLFELFKTSDEKLDKHTFLEAPGLKVLVLVNRQKEIIFEANRILINDKSKREPSKSEVVDDLEKIIQKGLVDRSKIVAYGFNYDLIAESEKNDPTKFINPEIQLMIPSIKSVGIKLTFEKNDHQQTLDVTPLREKSFLVHINTHYSRKLENAKEVKVQLQKDFSGFINLMKKL
jgi:hypothetical protein